MAANFFSKIYSRAENLYRQVTRQTNLEQNKYLPYFWGKDNFPLVWHKAISESPSATACVSTIQDFLEGFGFSDPDLEKLVVNYKNETLFQIHQKTCKDFGEFEGFAWRFMFDSTGKITEWMTLPFENIRLGKPDDQGYISKILYNPYFGTDDFKTIRDKETIQFDCYNPKAVKQQLLEQKNKYKGQVLFFGTTSALSRFYPLPEAHSCIEWMETETSVSRYHKSNIKNSFLQPFMLLMKGNPNEPMNNPESSSAEKQQTIAEYFDEVVSENFMGAERVGNMFVHWVTNPEEKPEILTIPSNNTGDMFVTIDNQATKKITIAFKVPAILANINEGVSLGGDGNMVRVAVKLMQQRVIKKQRMLTDQYQMILANFAKPYLLEISIAPYNPYPELEVIDDKIWNAMSREEQRAWIEKNTEIELIEEQPLEPVVPPQAKLINAVPVPFPDNIRNNIQKALDYNDKMGIKCLSNSSREVSEAIIKNQNMGLKQLQRLHRYLKTRPQFANSPYSEGCDVIKYNTWGGKDMEMFLESKLKELNTWLN